MTGLAHEVIEARYLDRARTCLACMPGTSASSHAGPEGPQRIVR
jgi:hypothetical protein